VKINNSDKRR